MDRQFCMALEVLMLMMAYAVGILGFIHDWTCFLRNCHLDLTSKEILCLQESNLNNCQISVPEPTKQNTVYQSCSSPRDW
jgi:hypothetical protein